MLFRFRRAKHPILMTFGAHGDDFTILWCYLELGFSHDFHCIYKSLFAT